MKVVALPVHNVDDISGGLRRIADDIDAGKYREAYNLLWIVDCGNGKVESGMLGQAAEPVATAILLMRLAEHKLLADITAESK